MLPRYSPSGRCGPSLLVFFFPALAGSVIAAGVYTLLSHWIPFIYLDALLSFGLALAIFWIATLAARSGRCRNPAIGGAAGALLGIFAILASHYTAYLWDTRSLPAGTYIPLADYIQLKVKTGWTIGRSSSGIPLTGWAVWLIWAIEAAIVIGAGFLGGAAASREPFCEPCRRWADKETHAFDIPGLSPQSIQQIARAADVEAVMVPPLNEIRPGPVVVRYRVRSCPTCAQSAFLDLQLLTTKLDEKGKASTEKKPLGDCIVLNPAEVDAIGQLKTDVNAALAVGASGAAPTAAS